MAGRTRPEVLLLRCPTSAAARSLQHSILYELVAMLMLFLHLSLSWARIGREKSGGEMCI